VPGYDVIVVGLGGMGSAATADLARRGARVLGLERFGAGHDRGASHGGSRIIRDAYYEGASYVPLVRRARELWARLEEETGAQLLRTCGGIYAGDAGSPILAGSIATAQAWDVPHEVLDAAGLRRRFPTMAPRPKDAALFEPGAGILPPEQAVRAQLAVAARHGATLHFDDPAVAWSATAAGVRVETERGRYDAGALVLTLGAWTEPLLGGLELPLRVERRAQHWFVPAGPLDGWRPDRHPVWIWDHPEGTSIYGFPLLDGAVKVGLHSLGQPPKPTTPGEIDRVVAAGEVQEAARLAALRLPDLPGRHVRSAVCTYTLTPDEHFVIGPHPVEPRVSIAAGFSGHGFKFAPLVGEVLADLSTTGSTRHDIKAFDPTRFAP
jgi:sarcosine oxidase